MMNTALKYSAPALAALLAIGCDGVDRTPVAPEPDRVSLHLEGTVRAFAGGPVAGASVHVRADGVEDSFVRADSAGNYSVQVEVDPSACDGSPAVLDCSVEVVAEGFDSWQVDYDATCSDGSPQRLDVTLETATEPERIDEPPNVLLIIADDLRADIFGPRTPNLSALAQRGLHFTNAFVVSSVCAPSRATIFTGLYPQRHGLTRNGKYWNRAEPNLFERLKQAGYRTGFIGKWHMGGSDDPPPWFDLWVSFPGQGSYVDPVFNVDGAAVQAYGHSTELLTNYARAFMHHSGPWFLTLSYKAVHKPFTPAPDVAGTLAGMPVELPASFTDPPLPEFAARVQGIAPDQMMATIRRYYESVISLDRAVGQVLSQIPAQTMVVFLGDNGFLLGEHGMQDKRVPYEPSIRIPFVVRYAAWGAGKRDDLVLNTDVAATILDAVLGATDFGDGVSLRTKTTRMQYEYEYEFEAQHPETPSLTAVRTLTDKTVIFEDGTGYWFDLVNDPDERNPVALNRDGLLQR